MHKHNFVVGRATFLIVLVLEILNYCSAFPKFNSSHLTNKALASSKDLKGRFREERFFFINFNQDACKTETEENGVCMKSSICRKLEGTSGGSCAQGFGTCCLFKKACSADPQTVSFNETRLTQQTTGTFVDSCRYVIPKQAGVCQIRLDFNEFNIDEGPNAVNGLGDCSTDTFDVSGNTNGMLGHLCGNLKGQHMYLEYGQNANINLDISLASNMGQTWDILVTMIKCDSPDKAPAGCLQYFTGQRGRVTSFNFNVNKHQLNDQDYSVCVRTNPGMTKITWKRCTSDISDFYVSGEQLAVCPINAPPECVPQGSPGAGSDCTTDWVMIYGDNKYCGSGFPGSAVSMTRPFMMQVHFDRWEVPPNGALPGDDTNSGFCLTYAQSAF